MDEDLNLVEEILKGNTDSFNILVNKYELAILKFVYNMIRSKETAEDISQEVFITAYNKLYTFKKDYKFSNWLFQIARNKSIDYIRKYKRVYESNLEEAKETISKEISPEENAEYREVKRLIEEFLKTLNEEDRQILFLKYSKEGTTFSDISEIINMNESTVKRKYYNAREKFKQYRLSKERKEV